MTILLLKSHKMALWPTYGTILNVANSTNFSIHSTRCITKNPVARHLIRYTVIGLGPHSSPGVI